MAPLLQQMIRSVIKPWAIGARRALHLDQVKHWRVAVRRCGNFLDEAATFGRPLDTFGFQWLMSPRGRYFADPFLFPHGGTTWMFAEEYDYRAEKAWISVAPLTEETPPDFRECLVRPSHLSFPIVFEDAGDVFMIPEAAGANEVTLYRATRFPYVWQPEKVLLRGDYVDTVVWHAGGRWWLLTSIRDRSEIAATTAVLFSSDGLHGEWRTHPASPLFRDAARARNGGGIIQREGKIFRISQDCSVEYGRSFSINEVTRLDGLVYEERHVGTLTPDSLPGAIGTHTYSRAGEWEAIDACFQERRLRVA